MSGLSPYSQPSSLQASHTLHHYIHPNRPRVWSNNAPMPKNPLKWFKWASPNHIAPALPLLSQGTYSQGSCPQIPSSLFLVTDSTYKDNAFIIIVIMEVLRLDGELTGSRGEQKGKLHKGGCVSFGTKDWQEREKETGKKPSV